MQKQQSKKQQNLADEIYAIFKLKNKTALRRNDLIKAFKNKYCRPLIMMDLRELPFLRFESNGNGGNSTIHLSIELDDCCTKCKWDYCKLLHCVSISDKFETILNRPRIRLIQRLKNILTKSESMTLSELKRRHNSKYAQFKLHEPTASGIAIRFKSTFHIEYDEDANDYVITFKNSKQHKSLSNGHCEHDMPRSRAKRKRNNESLHPHQSKKSQKPKRYHPPQSNGSMHKKIAIIPEQCNKAYLCVNLHSTWMDSKLIPDLVRHISQFTGRHIVDAYIANRTRLGFFTAKNVKTAQSFLSKTQSGRMKCWSRTVNAEIVPLPKNTNFHRIQSGTRVRITNVNNVMGKKDFEYWVHKMTNTNKQKQLVYDIEIVFPKISRGASHCILLFDKEEDVHYVQKKMKKSTFRNVSLKFEQWHHPKANQSAQFSVNTMGKQQRANYHQSNIHVMNHQNVINNNNVIKSLSSSMPQTKSIWAQMANQRKQRKEQLKEDSVTKSEIIQIERSLLDEIEEDKNGNHDDDDDGIDIDDDDESKNILQPMKVDNASSITSNSSICVDQQQQNDEKTIEKEESESMQMPQKEEEKLEQLPPTQQIESETVSSTLSPAHNKDDEEEQSQLQSQRSTPQRPQTPSINELLQQQINALPPQQQLLYLQQLQLQQQFQRAQQAPIRMVNINQMQQLQQLQQQSQHPQIQIPIPITPQMANIPMTSVPNMQYPHPYNLSMQPNMQFLAQMPPPPPSAFHHPVRVQNNNNSGNWSPPRHNRQNQQNANEIIQSQPSPQTNEIIEQNDDIENEMKKEVPQQQSEEKKENAKDEIKKSNGPIDRLCKYCLLSEHEPSKCVWFNPNINAKQLKSNKD